MGRCLIIAPLYQGEEKEWLEPREGDWTVCADGGLDAALRYGLKPDLVIGDFDSMPFDHVGEHPFIRLPVHKDDTDTVVCLREGRKRGYSRFIMAGCIGGRLDHTISNLQCLYDCALRGEEAWMTDALNRVTVLTPGRYEPEILPGRYLSLLSMTPETRGVCLTGTEWPLENAVLTSRYPLGCSNTVTGDKVTLSFTEGALILIWSKDRNSMTL